MRLKNNNLFIICFSISSSPTLIGDPEIYLLLVWIPPKAFGGMTEWMSVILSHAEVSLPTRQGSTDSSFRFASFRMTILFFIFILIYRNKKGSKIIFEPVFWKSYCICSRALLSIFSALLKYLRTFFISIFESYTMRSRTIPERPCKTLIISWATHCRIQTSFFEAICSFL